MSQEIVFTIEKDGSTTVEAKGFTGSSCKDATKDFEKALGKVEDRKKKPEYFQTNAKTNKGKLTT